MVHDLVFLVFIMVPVGLVVVPMLIARRRRSRALQDDASESPT